MKIFELATDYLAIIGQNGMVPALFAYSILWIIMQVAEYSPELSQVGLLWQEV